MTAPDWLAAESAAAREDADPDAWRLIAGDWHHDLDLPDPRQEHA